MSWMRRVLLWTALVAAAAIVAGQSPPAPVFVLLVSTIEDHLNEAASLERIDRTLPVVARYRKAYPQFKASWLVRFTGLVSDRLAEVSHANHVVDVLKRNEAEGLVEFGYDGTDEPTFVSRPRPNFRRSRTPEDRWLARVEALEWFLTEGKDPITGEPNPNRAGGLRRTLEVFGTVEAVRGITLEIGGDPELAHLLQRMGIAPLVPGFGETTAYPGRTLAGYRGATGAASNALAPEANVAPELYWQDGLLTLSEYISPDSKVLVAREGVAALKKALTALDRSRPHIVQVRLADPGVYTKPGFGERRYQNPLEYSYENPRSPNLPDDALRSKDDTAAEYAKQEEVLRWLVTDFFPASPGSRFVSVRELKRMTGPVSGFEVRRADLVAAAKQVPAAMQKVPLYLPTFVRAGDRYLSLTDLFSLLVMALSQADRTGALAETVKLLPLYGPRGLVGTEEGPVGTRVPRSAVLRACSNLAESLFAGSWKPLPDNTVPSVVDVGGRDVSAAQFLLLITAAYVDAAGRGESTVEQVLPFSVVGESFPGTRPTQDRGTTWTLKPAPIQFPD